MEYAKSYTLSHPGVTEVLLDVTKKLNEEFDLGTVGVDGFDLNVEPESQLGGATIRYRDLEPERIKLEIFDGLQRPRDWRTIIESVETDVRSALVRIKSRLTNGLRSWSGIPL